MRIPIRHIAGHLCWSTHGSVWAIYRLHPGPDAQGQRAETVQGTHVPAAVRDEQLAKITHLVRSLSGSPRLFGLCAQVAPGEIALRMIEGIEPAEQAPGAGRHPWMENVEATLDLLDDQEMHRRTLWLAVPLQTETGGLQVSAALGAAWAEITPMMGIRPVPVARREVTACREQASRVEAALAGGIAFRPARPAEIVWMIQHALHRGLAEPLLAEAETSDLYGGQIRDGVLRSPSYADLGQVRLQEGGIDPDLDNVDELKGAGRITRSGHNAWWRLNSGSPLGRRWLQVESDAGVGYQAQLALAECPPAVSQDAADLFAQLEMLDFPVDYTVDLTLVPAEKARDQVRRKKNELIDQADQYDARPTGMPASLTEAARDLGELDARLSRTSVEVEVQSVTALTVWGPTAAVCPSATGQTVALDDLLNDGPVVLTFYRGAWCPYCNIALRSLQQHHEAISARGARLVAVSPQIPDESLTLTEKHDLAFDVLSDIGSDTAKQYGLPFDLPDDLSAVYDKLGFDLQRVNDGHPRTLPLPATYVIDRTGAIRWAFVDTDYTTRAEPADIIATLDALH